MKEHIPIGPTGPMRPMGPWGPGPSLVYRPCRAWSAESSQYGLELQKLDITKQFKIFIQDGHVKLGRYVPDLTAPYCTLRYLTTPHCTLRQLTVPNCTLLYPTAPYCTLLHITVPYCALLHLIAPYLHEDTARRLDK